MPLFCSSSRESAKTFEKGWTRCARSREIEPPKVKEAAPEWRSYLTEASQSSEQRRTLADSLFLPRDGATLVGALPLLPLIREESKLRSTNIFHIRFLILELHFYCCHRPSTFMHFSC